MAPGRGCSRAGTPRAHRPAPAACPARASRTLGTKNFNMGGQDPWPRAALAAKSRAASARLAAAPSFHVLCGCAAYDRKGLALALPARQESPLVPAGPSQLPLGESAVFSRSGPSGGAKKEGPTKNWPTEPGLEGRARESAPADFELGVAPCAWRAPENVATAHLRRWPRPTGGPPPTSQGSDTCWRRPRASALLHR